MSDAEPIRFVVVQAVADAGGAMPEVHHANGDMGAARAAAERLALAEPGTSFAVFQRVDAVTAELQPKWSK